MTTQKTIVKVFSAKSVRQGFTFQEGFAALIDEDDRILASTSGWEHNGALYVYRQTPEGGLWGEWVSGWEGEDTFPVEEVRSAISIYERHEQIERGLRYLRNRKPHISKEALTFTDTVAGRKSRDGGEYGFWTTYTPLPGYPGLYEVWSHTTCEISDCNTGYEGIRALSEKGYQKMRLESDRIEREGFIQ